MKKIYITLLIVSFLFLGVISPMLATQAALETKQNVTVVFFTGVQTTNALTNMIADYNANHAPSGVTIDLQTSTWETQNQHDTYATKFAAGDSSFDVISMDVIWPPEFTAAGWLEPLDDIFPASEQAKFLTAPIEAGTYQGSIYGVPWFHDSAMLFYRTDVIEYAFNNGIIPRNGPPETWSELHDWTLDMLNNTALVSMFEGTDGVLEGFVWQGKQYEGLVCDFMEYLGGTGTYSFLNADQTAAAFDSQGVKDALEFMRTLLLPHQGPVSGQTISVSPIATLTYHEETSRAVWNAGNAIFHRNWPYCYRLSADNSFLNGSEGGTSAIYDVAVMPHQDGKTEYRTSCLGGWQLGLNKFSTHKQEAKDFILWLTDAAQQETYLIGNGNIPTREAVYSDPDVLASDQAYVNVLLPVFKKALPRPVHPKYPEMSAAIWAHLQNAIADQVPIVNATDKMNEVVNEIIGEAAPTGIPALEFGVLIAFTMVTLVIYQRKKRKRG